MQFSEDSQLLLTLTGAPDWTLLCWNWSKAKLVAYAQVSNIATMPFTRCSFSPVDASIACVTGRDCVKFFRIADKDMRVVHDNVLEGNNFISQCWLRHPDDSLLAGTDTGDLVLFKSGEYVCHLGCSPGSEKPITSLLSVAKGFIFGSKPGFIQYIKFDDEKLSDFQQRERNRHVEVNYNDFFVPVRSVLSDLTLGSIQSICLSPNEESCCALTSDNQLLNIPLLNPAVLTPEDIKLFQISFHGPKAIQGMGVCLRKPLIITCSKDNTLRIWNYLTNETELLKVFPEDMFCSALHPSGIHAAVGFSDKLRVYHVLVDDIRVCLEVPIKACRECKFSPGGNLIAAANGNSIGVYDFSTGEKVSDLRGHNNKVHSIHWLDSGCRLLSCGRDGAVYLWELDGRRSGEFVNKGIMYTSAVCSDKNVFAVGTDKKLVELDILDLSPSQLARNEEITLGLLAISAAKGVLFATAGELGKPCSVRAYSYPLTGDFTEYTCLSSQASRMCLTPDELYLVVADDSGCITLFELRDRNERILRNPNQISDMTESPDWTDEVLVTRAELEDKTTVISELRTKVEELKVHNEYQQKLKEMNYSENIKEVTDKFLQELEQSRTTFELLKEERVDCELEHMEKLKQMAEQHQHDLQEVETDFQAQIMEQVDAYHSLVRERDAQIERLEEQRRMLVEAHEQYVEELTSDFEQKLEEDRQSRLMIEDEKSELHKELVETCRQLEDDIDSEIENMRRGYEDKLSTARESTLKFKGENGMLNKKLSVMRKDMEDQREEQKILLEKEHELHEQIKILEKEITLHKKEIKTRDGAIGEKEKRIYELKKKNQELDKFKFVLDFKIRELKRQIEPRQQEIAGMKDQIRAMDEELEKYHKSNSNLDGIIGALRTRIDSTQQDIKDKRSHAKKLESSINAFKSDLHMTIEYILDPHELMKSVEKLVTTHGAVGAIVPSIDPEVNDEYERHKEFLTKSIFQLKTALDATVLGNQETTVGLMQTNLKLIDEINEQRGSNRKLKEEVQADVGRITFLARVAADKKAAAEAALEGSGASTSSVSRKGSDRKSKGLTSKTGKMPSLSQDKFDSDYIHTESKSPLLILERNRRRIMAIRGCIAELEGRMVMQHSYSREMVCVMF